MLSFLPKRGAPSFPVSWGAGQGGGVIRYILALWLILLSNSCFAFEIRTASFDNGSFIPSKFTCDGANISPALSWQGAPLGTKSFALICDDPNASSKTWSHWVIFNIPVNLESFVQAIPPTETFENGVIQGMNDSQKTGYSGPCPPKGPAHRYYFRIYALDSELLLDQYATRETVLDAIRGHILAQANTYGTYSRN